MLHNVARWGKRATEAPEFIRGERHKYLGLMDNIFGEWVYQDSTPSIYDYGLEGYT
ncbi:MAG: hypothetical protein Kow00117_22760 [Phototrophicales bacterium]